jgi:terminase large subunit-like protein
MTDVTVKRRRLHPGQLRIRQHPARFRVVMCGRRFGKTLLGVDEAQEALLKGQAVGWFCPTYKYAVEPWADLRRRLLPITKKANEQERRLELLTGGVLEVWTCDTPDVGRSRAYDLAIFDEAGIIAKLETIWQADVRPTLTDRQGRALFLGTPKGRTHAFSTLFAKAQNAGPDWAAFRAPTAENTTLPGLAQEIEAARHDMPAQAFAQEYEGLPADDGGNPFGLEAIAACVVQEWTQPPEAPMCWGWDFARAQDWTVGIALDAHYNVTRLQRWQLVPWGETKQMVQQFTGAVPAWGDSTGVGDAVVEDLQRAGCPMIGVPFSRPMKQKLMERLARTIQQRQVRFPDGAIRSELETFTFEYTSHGVRYTAPEGMHDDCVMALALAVFGRDQFGQLPQPEGPLFVADKHPGFDVDQRRRRKPWEDGWQPDAPPRGYVPSKELIPL